MKNSIQFGLFILTFSVLLLIGYNIYLREITPPEQKYTDLLHELENKRILSVHFKGGWATTKDEYGRTYRTYVPDLQTLIPQLISKNITLSAEPDQEAGTAAFMKYVLLAMLVFGGWLLFSNRSGKKLPFAENTRSKRFSPVTTDTVTFEDVEGIAEAKLELQEIVQFLKNPEKYREIGARIPRGVLLQGSPGTGKTLLAKAIAGEADVAFFSLGGSDFVEMFVGVGASRVRELFDEAKHSAPCIIFIDEIDAIGGRRSGGTSSGASDEREQTLNALLVAMDGFSSGETIIVVAATNRPEILDPALLRPGRFDRQITIPVPDVKGRIKILAVHTQKIRMAPDVDLPSLARSIPGFSGAEIANLVNEAALMAARHDKNLVEMADFEEAKDKIIMGLERKSVVVSEQDRRVTAYHEAGHAIVGMILPDTDPIHKITIIPRGRAMGMTQQLPLDDRNTYSLEYLLARIKTLMGGRVAEALVFHRLTTGASNDILVATQIAQKIVCEWGMSETMGPIAYGPQENRQAPLSELSEQTSQAIDREIQHIITECYEETTAILTKHNKFLHKFAEALLLNETLDAEEADIVYRHYVREREMERKLSGVRSE
ncbi:ATP-dependent zinc metalloprotease FtsH [Desulfogranum japonicum]|uniref:ATP-dependent zinc metalloprotease FtsH n=1 Tax=Desulfogranum japonicum TaxID=231447 RepID=UPI000409CD82|nr:ATP-dependent zinc metalloprotease FtsH [Desulfogranum japonicum]